MQIVDNLHEMSNPVFGRKYRQLSSAELAQGVEKVNEDFSVDISGRMFLFSS